MIDLFSSFPSFLLPFLAVSTLCVLFFLFRVLSKSGDSRYKEGDPLGPAIRLFQILTFSQTAPTQHPRLNYVNRLKVYIDNFNEHSHIPIEGNTDFVKETIYYRMTKSNDFYWLDKISTNFIMIANGKLSYFQLFPTFYYLFRCGFSDPSELFMKTALTATFPTLGALPDLDTSSNLKEKAAHYRLIRYFGDNPFIGVNACPILNQWNKIVMPKIINTDGDITWQLTGEHVRYLDPKLEKQSNATPLP